MLRTCYKILLQNDARWQTIGQALAIGNPGHLTSPPTHQDSWIHSTLTQLIHQPSLKILQFVSEGTKSQSLQPYVWWTFDYCCRLKRCEFSGDMWIWRCVMCRIHPVAYIEKLQQVWIEVTWCVIHFGMLHKSVWTNELGLPDNGCQVW